MALPKHMYQDPARQALDKEAATCKGCRWRKLDAAQVQRCENRLVVQILADKRCKEYEEK